MLAQEFDRRARENTDRRVHDDQRTCTRREPDFLRTVECCQQMRKQVRPTGLGLGQQLRKLVLANDQPPLALRLQVGFIKILTVGIAITIGLLLLRPAHHGLDAHDLLRCGVGEGHCLHQTLGAARGLRVLEVFVHLIHHLEGVVHGRRLPGAASRAGQASELIREQRLTVIHINAATEDGSDNGHEREEVELVRSLGRHTKSLTVVGERLHPTLLWQRPAFRLTV